MNRVLLKWACVLLLFVSCGCKLDSLKYTVNEIDDGGYVLNVQFKKRHLKLITAEGPFPIESGNYKIIFRGPGVELSYKNWKGYYYSDAEIESNHKGWDIACAWMDKERKFLYLKAYWFIPPDKLEPAYICGKYEFSR